jgi:hypothetical protein
MSTRPIKTSASPKSTPHASDERKRGGCRPAPPTRALHPRPDQARIVRPSSASHLRPNRKRRADEPNNATTTPHPQKARDSKGGRPGPPLAAGGKNAHTKKRIKQRNLQENGRAPEKKEIDAPRIRRAEARRMSTRPIDTSASPTTRPKRALFAPRRLFTFAPTKTPAPTSRTMRRPRRTHKRPGIPKGAGQGPLWPPEAKTPSTKIRCA